MRWPPMSQPPVLALALLLLAPAIDWPAEPTLTGSAPVPRLPVMTLWWRHPAKRWDQAVPLGNGWLGGMVFGRVAHERIQLNQDELWSGGPRDPNNPLAFAHLGEVRRLLFAGQPVKAMDLATRYLMGKPNRLRPYQSLGNLWLTFPAPAAVADYRLALDLDQAIARVQYRIGDTHYTREIFCSAVDRVLVVHLACDHPKQLSLRITLNRSQAATTRTRGHDRLEMTGQLDGGKGLKFMAELRARTKGGKVQATGQSLEIHDADAVTLVLTAATSYHHQNPKWLCRERVDRAANRPYANLKADQIANYRRLFRRVWLDLGADLPALRLPTDERLQRVRRGATDSQLIAQYFQLGRYLLISSSRPGHLPANLQGLWAEGMNPPWNSDFHLNINLEMNYWPAEVCNLPECAEPLFDLIDSLREPGHQTARVEYHCSGFVVHHITDLWGFTAPGDTPRSGLWPMGAAWLCHPYWEHYAFSGNRRFLAHRAYPVMKAAARFFLDYLVASPQGSLVTGPSLSPENSYRLPNGQVGHLCMGPTMDTEILHDLFAHCLRAATVLHRDAAFRARLRAALHRLPPLRIGRHGQIMEWLKDYDEPDPGHRHLSPLFALCPGNWITPRGTPELARAARVTLERRLEYGPRRPGWSWAWMINCWARLGDGEQAYQALLALLRQRTLPNLLDLCPPFQIDGNFGGTAGIAAMLLQSQNGEIDLLPAVPQAWPFGAVDGLRARGGFEVNLLWREGRFNNARILSYLGRPCRLRTPVPVLVFHDVKGRLLTHEQVAIQRPSSNVVQFPTEAGKAYLAIAAPPSHHQLRYHIPPRR